MKNKLLQIVVEGNTGSTGRMANSIGDYVIDRGWESYIAFGRYPKPSKSYLIKIGTYLDILYHGFLTRIFDFHGLGSTKATQKLIKHINFINPDIIHLHHLHGYYINYKVLFDFLSTSSIPVVWTFHDCWAITGHCCHFDHINCDKWMLECERCPQKLDYPASLFFDNSKDNFRLKKNAFNSLGKLVIVSVSNWLNEIVKKSFIKNASLLTIYNGVDVTKFKFSKSSHELKQSLNLLDRFIILGVAFPWTSKKGFNDFILLSSMLKDNEVIVLVGLKPEQIKKLPKNIIGVPKTDSVELLVEYYSMADIFLNLSVEETFGLTTVESLACGTPAIVYNSTACPEIIDNLTGIIVDKKNINQLYDSVTIVKRNSRRFYSDHCRERAVSLFNSETCLLNYFKLYNDILNN